MLWAVSSYHMHTHTHTHAWWCVLGFVTYLHHCCVTTVPPLLCCLIVSIHLRQSYLKHPLPPLLFLLFLLCQVLLFLLPPPYPVTPPNTTTTTVYQRVPTLEMFICTSLCCFSVPVLLVWVFMSSSLLLLTLSFGKLPICQAGVLHSPSHTGKKNKKKKKKKGINKEV